MRSPQPIGMLIGALAVIACASSGTQSPSTITDRVVMTDQHGQVYHSTDVSTAQDITVRTAPANAIAVLTQTYTNLGIPIGTLNSQSGEVGNKHYRITSHSVGGKRVSYYLDCGADPRNGIARADAYDVTMSVVSVVTAVGDSTSLVTTDVEGDARAIGVSGDPIHCSTTGQLEHAIGLLLIKSVVTS